MDAEMLAGARHRFVKMLRLLRSAGKQLVAATVRIGVKFTPSEAADGLAATSATVMPRGRITSEHMTANFVRTSVTGLVFGAAPASARWRR